MPDILRNIDAHNCISHSAFFVDCFAVVLFYFPKNLSNFNFYLQFKTAINDMSIVMRKTAFSYIWENKDADQLRS